MFNVVLVPIDVAQMGAAAAALAAARECLAKDGKLFLLNVVEEVPGYVASQIPRSVHEQVVANARETLTQMAEDHKLPTGTEVLITDGHASRTILEVAGQIKADMIVLASHDPGLADYFLGSVAARVVRHAHCSVMVVRNVGA